MSTLKLCTLLVTMDALRKCKKETWLIVHVLDIDNTLIALSFCQNTGVERSALAEHLQIRELYFRCEARVSHIRHLGTDRTYSRPGRVGRPQALTKVRIQALFIHRTGHLKTQRIIVIGTRSSCKSIVTLSLHDHSDSNPIEDSRIPAPFPFRPQIPLM